MRNRHLSAPGGAAESGAALPLVLVIIAVLALVVATVTSGSAQELRMSRAFVRSNQAYYAALAGIQQLAARCAANATNCGTDGGGPAPPQGTLPNNTAYRVAFGTCNLGSPCQPPGTYTKAISVEAVGCTGVTNCDQMATPSTTTYNQGRRVLTAIVFFDSQSPNQSTFILLPPQ